MLGLPVTRTALVATLLLALAAPHVVCAQESPPSDDEEGQARTEEPDQTRLDVERLPPEAIQVTRDLYAHGLFVEAQIGALGFQGGIGELTSPGPWASLSLGYEIFDWLHVLLSAEGSMHDTNAPPPPARTAFELLGASVSLRLQANFTEAFALWIAPQFGVLVATTDILDIYGYQDASTVGITYGGELGADWHFRARHHSIGLLGGARHYPSLQAPGGSPAIGIHGSAYMRYVF